MYDALTPEEQGRQHPICQNMLGPGPVRIQLCRFIMGAPLDGLPRLLVFASKFRFISVLESRCEAEHNLTRKAIANAPSPYSIGVRSATCDQAATCGRKDVRSRIAARWQCGVRRPCRHLPIAECGVAAAPQATQTAIRVEIWIVRSGM